MAYVILPSRRKRPDLFELDHSHPLANGLALGFIPRLPVIKKRTELLINRRFVPIDITHYRSDHIDYGRDLGRNCMLCAGSNYNSNSIYISSSHIPSTVISFFVLYKIKGSSGAAFFGKSGSWNSGIIANRWSLRFGNTVLGLNPPSNKWCFLYGVYDGITAKLYDGKTWQSDAPTEGTVFNSSNLRIGGNPYDSAVFSGSVSDILIWDRPLSETEISLLSNISDPMLAGLIRDKKPAPKFWFLRMPNDSKIKTVTPVVSRTSWHGASISVPRPKVRPAVFELDHSHPLADGLVFAGLPSPHSPYYSEKSLYGRKDRADIRWRFSEEAQRWGVDTLGGTKSSINFSNSGGDIITPDMATSISVLLFVKKISTINYNSPFNCKNGYSNPGFVFWLGNSETETSYIRVETKTADFGTSKIGDLTHLAFTYDGSNIRYYTKGRRIGTLAASVSAYSTTDLRIGHGYSYFVCDAEIYDPIIYNRVLSDEEVRILANPTDPMLDGLIRESKNRTYHAFNSKFNLTGVQDGNNLKLTWGDGS